ncbi:nucleotide-sugar transporter-domain-containing protein [Cokeromyces recurvatus]|uniref:nucleotide-sugar transporter-domain-containing protein n=1 Tax=Cokeromyces recurvatus TaxID=90255 RepID=UPI00221F4662|nr:nucleotide-sugar transporter-domain-containing protein [Cokeromyces recurvatus]KAI7898862.1 nucleotide-sugar transporter-domain-containing protein [Cokeromyces recurvatus]
MSHYSKRIFKKKHELPISYEYPTTNASSVNNVNLKQLSLFILIIQNTMLVLVMRYSRTTLPEDQPMYIASTAVFMAEIIKIITCFSVLYYQGHTLTFFHKPREILKMLIPSSLYALQNNLLYIALSNLEAATFQVTYQLKILSTAIFSVIMLGRTLTSTQWFALVLLMAGVTLVQSETVVTTNHSSLTEQQQNPLVGLVAVLMCCISSGFAGCYFEKILKSSISSMWVRNIQLALCGALFSFIAMLIGDFDLIKSNGFFQGYNALTWCVIVNQALGGLLVALVVKYADNILKGFATSISIIVSGLLSFCLFDFKPSILFIIGTGIVILSTVLYTTTNNNNKYRYN